jgi:hypothetical protein
LCREQKQICDCAQASIGLTEINVKALNRNISLFFLEPDRRQASPMPDF